MVRGILCLKLGPEDHLTVSLYSGYPQSFHYNIIRRSRVAHHQDAGGSILSSSHPHVQVSLEKTERHPCIQWGVSVCESAERSSHGCTSPFVRSWMWFVCSEQHRSIKGADHVLLQPLQSCYAALSGLARLKTA